VPTNAFDVLILIARPAAGKSEAIHYLKSVPLDERTRRFHVAEMAEIDDFPMLWAWFEEDDVLERLGLPRLHSTPDYEFNHLALWHVLIERISLEYAKLARDPGLHERRTVLVEFSRGAASGGYREAFQHLSDDLLRRAALLYINVSYAESLRKNRKRFNPDAPDSILQHSLPDHKMEALYRDDDFAALAANDPEWLSVREVRVPYAIFENEDDVTSGAPGPLAERLEEVLGRLWSLACRR
jgi:hypothetical protein